MHQILDHDTVEEKPKKLFARIAFLFSILTLFLLKQINSFIPTTIRASEALTPPSIPQWLTTAVLLSSVLGLLISFWSFHKKETSSIIKWAGAIINLIFFALVFGSIIFANVV